MEHSKISAEKELNTHFDGDPDYSVEVVPEESRMSRWSLMMAYWALCSAAFWLVVSATLANTFGAVNTIAALIACVAIYGILGSLIARFAISTGLSVDLFSRTVYGKAGGLLATLIFFVTAIYYCVFEGSVIAIAFQSAAPSLSMWHAYLIVVIYSVPLVFGGVAAFLDKFNALLLPFYIVGLAVLVYLSIDIYGYDSDWLTMGPDGAQLDTRAINAFVYYMGIAVNLMFSWDYSRFGKRKDTEFHAKLTFGMPFYLATFFGNGVIGIFLAGTVPLEEALTESSIVFVILAMMGLWGVLFLWVSQTRINTANFQEATVNLQAFLKHLGYHRVTKIFAAVAIGIVVFALMLTDVFSFLLEALAYQGVFVVAWVAVAITHITNVPAEEIMNRFEVEAAESGLGLSHPSLVVWLLSSAVGVFCIFLGGNAASYAAPITAATAVSLYFISLRVVQSEASA